MNEFRDTKGIFGFEQLYPSTHAYVAVVGHPALFALVNCALQCASYALIDRGHFFVDFSQSSIKWSDLFETSFASGDRELDYAQIWFPGKKVHKPLWRTIQQTTRQGVMDALVHELPEIGFRGELENLVARMADAIFEPVEPVRMAVASALRELGLDNEPYGAFHVRRGDKVKGYFRTNGRFCVEGELVPLAAYVDRLRTMSPTISKIFLMTDDYGAFEEATASYPELTFVTLCPPTSRGYDQVVQNASSAEQQLRNQREVLRDIAIARGAETFVGAYRSNVSLFIHVLRGLGYDRSASADSVERWNFI